MDLKERLRQLSSISNTPTASTEEDEGGGDLRGRLDRLLPSEKIYRKRELFPIDKLVDGKVVSTPEGETFQAEEYFPSHFRYGEMTPTEILDISSYPAHLLSRDDRLRG